MQRYHFLLKIDKMINYPFSSLSFYHFY